MESYEIYSEKCNVTAEEMKKYFILAKEGDTSAREKAIIYNTKLVFKRISEKYWGIPYDKNDLISVGMIGLVKAVDHYDTSRNIEFSTYAYRCIDLEIVLFLKKMSRNVEAESLEKEIYVDTDGNSIKLVDELEDLQAGLDMEDIFKRELNERVRSLVNNLNGREKEILKLYFGFYNNKMYTQKEIANMLGFSKATISSDIIRCLDKIEQALIAENYLEKQTIKRRKVNVRRR